VGENAQFYPMRHFFLASGRSSVKASLVGHLARTPLFDRIALNNKMEDRMDDYISLLKINVVSHMVPPISKYKI
jgi:hypothetical protein